MTALSERVLIVALAWGAFAFGAVYPWGYWPLAIVAAALGLSGLHVTAAWRDHRIRTLAIALFAIAVALVIQTINLPYSLVQHLSPGLDRFFQQFALSYHPASLHSLSLSASATLSVLALFVPFSLLLLGLTAALRVRSLEWLLNQLMGLGLALAVVGIVQRAFPMDTARPLVFGFWAPRQGGNPFGPFINRNHFAGWMVMALPLIVGYSCAVLAQTFPERERRFSEMARWLTTVEAHRFTHAAFCALVMGMALVLTGSRSGVASFAVAMIAFAALAVRKFQSRRARLMMAGYLILILAGALVWAGLDATVGRFLLARVDSGGRLAAWQDTLTIVRDFPLFGTGMGTYGQAMLVYQTENRPVMFAQAHNEYLQILAEGGAVVAIPVLSAVGVVLATLYRRLIAGTDDLLTSWVRVGAIAGLVGIATQSFVEFSLRMPGNMMLGVVLLALTLHRGRGRSDGSRERRSNGERDAHRV